MNNTSCVTISLLYIYIFESSVGDAVEKSHLVDHSDGNV